MDNTTEKIQLNNNNFFTQDIWSLPDIAAAESITSELLQVYSRIMAEYHGLSEKDACHLSREMTAISVSVFLDTYLRLKKAGQDGCRAVTGDSKFQSELDKFFKDDFTGLSLGASSIFRSRLADLISLSLGYESAFNSAENDPVRIKLEETGIRPSVKQDSWLLRYYLDKIPDKIFSSMKICLNLAAQKTKPGLLRIGYIEIDRKYFLQLPDIEFVHLDIDISRYLHPVTTQMKKYFYDFFLQDFLSEIKSKGTMHEFTSYPNNENLLCALFALMVIETEPLLLDRAGLIEALNFSRDKIASSNIRAVFSVGNWFRFSNAVIAVAARSIKLPVIQYQLGGRYIYKIGRVASEGELDADHYLVWGQWKEGYREESGAKLHKAPSPYLYELQKRGRRHRPQRSKKLNVLYSPIGVSHLFRTDNNLSFNPDQMKSHRLLLQNALQEADKSEYAADIDLFVKIKGFGYTLYKDYEYMLFPRFNLNRIRTKYIFKGNSERYFDFIDLHLFDGLATTFVNSLSYNIPSIVFWNNKVLLMHSEYMPMVTKMIQLGIIVTGPQQFSDSLRSFYEDRNYWFSREIQKSVSEYLDLFGYISKDWKNENQSIIKEIILGQH